MENSNQKPKTSGFKKSKLSVLPIICSSILAAGALTGSGFSIAKIAKNYTESPEFTKTVEGRIKIDPAATLTDTEKDEQDYTEARDIVAECARKLSRWLKDKGQDKYDVSYEVYPEKTLREDQKEGVPQYWGYLSAQFEIDKVNPKHPLSEEEEDKKIDNDPYLSFFSAEGFNSNEKTLVYRWYNSDLSEEGTLRPQYTIIPFRQLFNIPKTIGKEDNKTKILTDKDGKTGVMYAVEDSTVPVGVQMNKIYKNFATAKQDSEKSEEDKPEALKHEWGKPRFYIVNNLEGLYNEANYHIANWWVNQNEQEYRNIYDETTYAGFAEDYKNHLWNGNDRQEGQEKQSAYHLKNGMMYDPDSKEGTSTANVDLFNYVDQKTSGTINPNAIFANKYIDDIITMDKIDNFFPEKITDEYKNVIDINDPKISYFWYTKPSKTDATKYLGNQIDYGFNQATIHDIEFSDFKDPQMDDAVSTLDRIHRLDSKKSIDPSFTETIFGGSNLIGMLSLGFLIFLVILLIILAALYRTTGVISWICMIFALSMTLLIVSSGAAVISMSLIIGLFTMAIAGFMAALMVCGRMKRRLYSHEDTQLMIRKTFKKSLLPVADITVLTLIFGICITYVAPMTLNALGLILVAGSFMMFGSMYLINGLLHILFFNNQIMVNKYHFFGKPSNVANEALTQGNNIVPTGMDATKLEIPFYSYMSKKRIDDTGKKALIAVSVAGALLIAAIVVFSVLGYTSSKMYHTSYCVAFYYEGDLLAQSWFTGLDYTHYLHDSSNWWYFYTNMGNAYSVAKQIAIAGKMTIGDTALVQSIFGSTSQDVLNHTLIAVAIGASVSCIYGLIRYNWISFVPMIATAFAMPLLILGIAAATQVKFDEFVIMGFVLVVIVNALYSATIVEAVNESWSRKDAYSKTEFKFIMNTVLTNCWTYIWKFALGYGLFILTFGLTAPKGLVLLIALFIIGWGVTTIFVPFIATFLLYQFAKVRNYALIKKAERSKNKVIVNYDEIDEQGIEGLNQFTKRIPVAPKQSPKETTNGQQASH